MLSDTDAGGVFFFLNLKTKLKTMSQKSKSLARVEADLYKELWLRSNRQSIELDHKASDALETMLKLYRHPDAFAVLKQFHWEFDESCGGGGLTFQDALNELGAPDVFPIAQLQRTLRRIKKEREVA